MSVRPPGSLRGIDAAGVGVALGLTALAFVFGTRPLLQARAEDRARATEVARREEEAARLTAALQAVEQRLGIVGSQLETTRVRLERADEINSRVAQLTDLSGALQLEINEIKPGLPSPDPHYTRVPIRMTGSGSFRASSLFLHQLRRRFPDTGLVSLEISGDPASDGGPLRFVFDLVWYAAPSALANAEK